MNEELEFFLRKFYQNILSFNVSAIGENFKKFSYSSQILKMCFTPNICLLKSCRGHHLITGFNRRIGV
jgi:hypothetical protein